MTGREVLGTTGRVGFIEESAGREDWTPRVEGVGTVREDESDEGGLRPDLTSGRGRGIVDVGGRIEEVEEGRDEESFDFVGGLFSFTVASRDVAESLTVLDRMEEGAVRREIEEEEGVGRGIPGA